MFLKCLFRQIRVCAAMMLTLVMSGFSSPVAVAQTADFPSRPIRIIVPFPAGGTADVLPRLMAERLRTRLGQNVVIENRPGAGGNIGAEAIFRAEADGHWLLASPPGPLAVNQSLYARLNYDASQFEPVTVLAQVPTVLVVGAGSRHASVREFVEAARARPEQLSFASQGNGSTSHLTTFLFQGVTGTRLVHVPYKGTAPALTDLMGGQIDIFFDNLGSSLPLHRSGKVRILAVADVRRSPVLPEVPTLAEAGVAGVQSSAWFGVVAPPGTPEAVVRKLNAAFAEVLRAPDIVQRFSEQGAVPVGGTPEQTRVFLRDEALKWRKIIQDARVTLD